MNYLKKIEKTVSSFQLSRRNYGAPYPPLQTPHKPGVNTAKNGVLFSLFPVFARRRRMASRLYPTPCEMNVKRSFEPTAELTKNQRKT